MIKFSCFLISIFIGSSYAAQSTLDSLQLKKLSFEVKNNRRLNKKVVREGFSTYNLDGNFARSWYQINSPKKSRRVEHSEHHYDSLNRPIFSVFYNGQFDSNDTLRTVENTYSNKTNEVCTTNSELGFQTCKRSTEKKLAYTAYISEYGENNFLQPHEYVDSVLLKESYKNDEYKDRELYFFKYDSLGRVSYEYQNLALGANSTHITYTYAQNTITKAYYVKSHSQWMKQAANDGVTYITTSFNTDSVKIHEECYTYSKSRDHYYDIWYIQDFDKAGNIVRHEFGGALYPDRKEKFSKRIILTTYNYAYDSNGQLIEKREVAEIKGSKNLSQITTYTYEYW